MSNQFDVVVIGAGPGGYIAAIRAAQLGFSVACIDEWKNAKGGPALGGTCTNVGCIPSKALLDSSEHYYNALNHFEEHGITTGKVKADLSKMIERKGGVVKKMNDGINYLMKRNGLHRHLGWILQMPNTRAKLSFNLHHPAVMVYTVS